jgi:hypothetical protein
MGPEIAPGLPDTRVGHHYLLFALSLAIIIAILEATVLITLNARSRPIDGAIYRTSAPIIIALGILIQSNAVRYLGSAWLALVGLTSIWKFFSFTSNDWNALVILLVISGLLGLALAAVLLASKGFGKQFDLARSKHPHLKNMLRRCVIAVGSLGAIIATYNDIVNLTR